MKTTIKNMLAGVLMVPLLAFGAAAVGSTTAMAANPDCTDDATGGIGGAAKCAQGEGQSTDLFGEAGVFTTITNVLLFIIGAIAVIMLVIGGIRYTVSGGDQAAVTSAKNTILYAIVGIIVAILAYAIVNFVVTSFAGDS